VRQPDGDLFSRPVRERHGADALGRKAKGVDEIVDTGDQAVRLPAPGPATTSRGERRFNGEALLGKGSKAMQGI